MMAANHGKRRCQKTGANPPPRSLLFELHISVGACWWEGSEGLLHPLLIQHLQWLSTLSLLPSPCPSFLQPFTDPKLCFIPLIPNPNLLQRLINMTGQAGDRQDIWKQ